MINRRFMIVPPALPSGGRTEKLSKGSKDFSRLQLEMANMREAAVELFQPRQCREHRVHDIGLNWSIRRFLTKESTRGHGQLASEISHPVHGYNFSTGILHIRKVV
jgi:hypothetical protein